MVATRSSKPSSSNAASTSKPIAGASNATHKSKSTASNKFPHDFPYDLPYARLCLRTSPHLYRTGVGEQGVLMVEPYKSKHLPHWRFKNPPTATSSVSKLYSIFLSYL